jgi:sulfatase modifying factor 1
MPRLSGLIVSLWIASSASAVAIDWTFVGDPGNACDPQGPGRCFGGVGYSYRIAAHEVTNAQYTEFLNAKAVSDLLGLYSPDMAASDISRQGTSGTFTYTVTPGRENRPVTYVTFYDVLRFLNWLHNGQGSGDTETGAYTLLGGTPTPSNEPVERNPGATIFLASDAEWYKAAYYDTASGTYFDYPAGTDAQIVCSAPTEAGNRANCAGAAGDLTDVGSYPGSPSPNGTFDQGGNVAEWTDTLVFLDMRSVRGGAASYAADRLRGEIQDYDEPGFEGYGFRVAPEADAGALLIAGVLTLLGLAGWRRVCA